MEEQSFYRNAVNAGAGKKFFANFIDLIIVLLISTLLYGLADLVLGFVPSYKNQITSINAAQEDLYSIVETTKLSYPDTENGGLADSAVVSKKNIKRNVMATLLNNGYTLEDLSETVYLNIEPITPSDEPIFYYFAEFKKENNSSFTTDYKKNGTEYYASLMVEYFDETIFDTTSSDGYYYLTLDSAKAINEYFTNDGYTKGYDLYISYFNSYEDILSFAETDVCSGYQVYLDNYNEFLDLSNDIFRYRALEIMGTYVCAILICFMLFPAIFKDGRSIAYRFMKLAYVTPNGGGIAWYFNLIQAAIYFFEYMVVMGIEGFLLYGTSGMYLLTYNIFGSVSFLALAIFSLFFMLLSIGFIFFNRNTHQSISEFASYRIAKNISIFNKIDTPSTTVKGEIKK